MKARMSRKFFCLLLTVVMVCTLLPIIALAAEPSGSIENAGITHAGGYLKNAVSVELKDVTFAESVAVKLYSGDTLLTTATLQGVNPGSYGFLTCCIATETADEYWALTPWTPKDDVVPDKAVLLSMDTNRIRRPSRLMPKIGQTCPARCPPAASSAPPSLMITVS